MAHSHYLAENAAIELADKCKDILIMTLQGAKTIFHDTRCTNSRNQVTLRVYSDWTHQRQIAGVSIV